VSASQGPEPSRRYELPQPVYTESGNFITDHPSTGARTHAHRTTAVRADAPRSGYDVRHTNRVAPAVRCVVARMKSVIPTRPHAPSRLCGYARENTSGAQTQPWLVPYVARRRRLSSFASYERSVSTLPRATRIIASCEGILDGRIDRPETNGFPIRGLETKH